MANSSDPLPSIPTNLNKLHRIYSDSEERNIEKTIVLPYDMTIVNLGNDKFYTSVFTAMSQDISYNSTMLSVLTPVSFNSMEFNPG